ncbi:hypothetical protein [Streptomyces sp. NPDC018045]|uniref:hypothetical protein n=1 Tax=Streptomyces sp. NPDC018045 TaxID=3365037 RepID=UPI0037B70020
MHGSRRANLRLRALLQQSAMTQEALARAVNAAGRERGLRLFYDRTSVAHWLRGARPRPPVPDLIADVLTRRLGRPITVATTGLTAPDDVRQGIADGVEVAERLARLSDWDAVPGYGEDLPGTPHTTLAAPGTRPDHEAGTPAAHSTRPWGRRQEADSVRMMLTCFTTLDAVYGGGHARTALVQYLACDIANRLKTRAGGPAWKELCGLTIRLTALCGTMSFDSQLHHVARSYYRTALDLAEQASDQEAKALVLHRISVHARFLGQRREALGLAEAALEATPPGCASTVRARRTGHLAACLADLSDHRGALSRLRRAEELLGEQGHAVGESEDQAENQAVGRAHVHWRKAEVLGAQGTLPEAVTAMRTAVRSLPPGHRRARLLAGARLGFLLLDVGETAQAAEVIGAFLDEAAGVRSALVAHAHDDLRSRCASLPDDCAGAAVWQRLLVSRPSWGAADPGRRWCCLS